jgi:hypothetical protein
VSVSKGANIVEAEPVNDSLQTPPLNWT